MSNKTICFFNSAKTWGGGEKWYFDIATRLNKKEYRVIVITNKKSELYFKLTKTNIKVHPVHISNYSFLNPFKKKQIIDILKTENVSTLIINLPADLKVAAPAAKKAGVLKTIYRRGSAIPIKNKLSNRILFKNYIDEIIANSEATKKTILTNNAGLFEPDKIKVIYNGLILQENANITDNQPIYLKQNNEFIIGNAGRFVKQKNHSFFVHLAVRLKKENFNFKILLAGSGKLQTEIEALAKQLKVDDKIVFTGFVNNVKKFMECIDIYILPSLWEGFGYVIAEAMLYKKPVIAFNLSSNPEILDDQKTGFLVEKNNIEETIEKIMLLERNKELREKMGLEGEKRVHKYFTIDKTVEEVEKIIV